jgi:transcriptional regulator with XRE-family HTH domain
MDKNYTNLISKRISDALKDQNVSQTELAQMIHKSKAYVSNIIKGRYLPKINEFAKIASYLKKPISYFFGDDTGGLLKYSDKAKKWDKVVSLIEAEINKDFREDVVTIPLLDNSQLRNKNFDELSQLKKKATEFVYLPRTFTKNTLHYYAPLEEHVAVKTFIRSYPEFGIETGDIVIYHQVRNNDIEDNSGKLFAVFYKGDIGIKRVYRDGKYYYFEPMHSSPVIEKIKIHDPDLVIPGRVVFVLHIKMF